MFRHEAGFISRIALPVVILAFYAASAHGFALLPGDSASGEKLHAVHCVECHGADLYTRKNRRVKTVEGLTGQVNLCNDNLNRNFSKDQIDDLVQYLNEYYYKFE